jgi:hypothetical protein
MALDIEQHIPLDEDRWTLNQVFDHLTLTLSYSEERALREMEQQRLAGHLMVQVHMVVDGKPQGDPEYLPLNKKHKLVRDLGFVHPLALKWSADRCTVYKQRILQLWPSCPPASPPAPDQQLEDGAGLDPLKVDAGRAALPATDPPKPSSTIVWITAEARQLKADGEITKSMSKTELAKLLAQRSQGPAKVGKLKKPLTFRYIRNQLVSWGLWPISSIK